MSADQQVSWMTIEAGTPVFSADEVDLGKVTTVIADRQKGIFSGIAFRSGLLEKERFVPGDAVTDITAERVRINIEGSAAESLEAYEP